MSLSAQRTRLVLRRMRRRRILVVGDVMLDHYIWGDTNRISPEAPVPVVEVRRDTYTPGGAANVALNCATLGAEVTLAGGLAGDEPGGRLRGLLGERGVKLVPLGRPAQTIVKSRVILQRQQLCRLDRESPPEAYAVEPAEALRQIGPSLADCDALILSDYAKGLLTDALVSALASEGKKLKRLVALDPKPRRPLSFHGLDLITPNRREAAQLAGVSWAPGAPFPAAEVCARIHEKYAVRDLVVTLSEDGLLLSREGRVLRRIPTAAREVADVSGAGDTSLATLVLALAAGAELEEAALLANAAAGVVVGKLGTATVTPAELLAYLEHDR